MAIDYASEKLDSALRSLILIEDTLRRRLIGVMTNDIGMIQADRDLPMDLRGRLDEINALATRQTSYEESINAMSETQVDELAEKIFVLYGNVQAAKSMSINPHEDFNR